MSKYTNLFDKTYCILCYSDNVNEDNLHLKENVFEISQGLIISFLSSGENGGKKSLFSFKLKRNSSVAAQSESNSKNLLFGRQLQDDATLPKPIIVRPTAVFMDILFAICDVFFHHSSNLLKT